MINRKQRCVRDGALASLLENERCQDLQEYQLAWPLQNLEIVEDQTNALQPVRTLMWPTQLLKRPNGTSWKWTSTWNKYNLCLQLLKRMQVFGSHLYLPVGMGTVLEGLLALHHKTCLLPRKLAIASCVTPSFYMCKVCMASFLAWSSLDPLISAVGSSVVKGAEGLKCRQAHGAWHPRCTPVPQGAALDSDWMCRCFLPGGFLEVNLDLKQFLFTPPCGLPKRDKS